MYITNINIANFFFNIKANCFYLSNLTVESFAKRILIAEENSFENLEENSIESYRFTSKHLYDLSVVLGAVLAFIKLLTLIL